VTDEERAMLNADDAELLNRVCAGETAAFQVLYQRHEQAARRLARDLVVTVDEVDEVVAETFDELLEVTRRGSGPADAFRPYLLTALRRVCERRRAQSQLTTSEDLPEPAEPYLDLAVAGLDDPLIVRAFLSLPERWMAVLWHADIEGASTAEVGPLLGLSRNGVVALRRRARAGLTRAYLQMYSSAVAARECTAVALRLGAFMRDAVSGPDSATVTEHLSHCNDCRAVFTELSDLSLPLRAKIAPVFLGSSAAYYLAGTATEHTATVHTAAAPVAGDHAAAGIAGWLRPAALVPGTARPLRWLAAGVVAVFALGGIAIAVSLAGHGTPLKPAGREQAQIPASPAVVATTSQASTTPTRSTTAPAAVRASASHKVPAAPPASPQGSTSPARPPATSPASHPPSPPPRVRLTAAVDIYGGHHHAVVVFVVSDTGSAKTKALIVSVALPAGSSFVSSSHGNGNGNGGGDGGGGDAINGHWSQDGWSCKATSGGALCRHASIPAGGQSQGMIHIAIDGSSACGQTVSVTAASGSASASAQSPEDIQC
jgi:RNA polymerase sigma factor (sigma-70 family)